MKGMSNMTGSAKSKIKAIKEMKQVDPTTSMNIKKSRDMNDFMSDSNLKPTRPGKGTRSA